MAQQRNIKQRQKAKKKAEWSFPLQRRNWYILAAGIAIILVGFGLMATAITSDPQVHQRVWDNPLAVSVAPIVLVIGFLVVIPYGIFSTGKNRTEPPPPPEAEKKQL